MKKSFILILTIFILSCHIIPKSAISNFTYCYNYSYKGLDSKLKLNGIFILNNKELNNERIPKSEVFSYTFHKDGFVSERWIQSIEQTEKYSKYGRYGLYKYSNDTIRIEMLPPPGSSVGNEYYIIFKIINNEKLELVYRGNIKNELNEVSNFKKKSILYKKGDFIFHFFSLDKIPNIDDTYIINKEWFWCSKEDFDNRNNLKNEK